MDDLLNKTFRTLIDPATNAGVRENARTQLHRMIGKSNAVIYLDSADQIAALGREKAGLKLELIELQERCAKWHRELVKVLNVLKHRATARFDDDSALKNTKHFLIDQIAAAGKAGVSKKAVMTKLSVHDQKSLSRRWSEVQNENHAFIISKPGQDEVLVHANHRSDYPKQWKAHESTNLAKINIGSTRRVWAPIEVIRPAKTNKIKETANGA